MERKTRKRHYEPLKSHDAIGILFGDMKTHGFRASALAVDTKSNASYVRPLDTSSPTEAVFLYTLLIALLSDLRTRVHLVSQRLKIHVDVWTTQMRMLSMHVLSSNRARASSVTDPSPRCQCRSLLKTAARDTPSFEHIVGVFLRTCDASDGVYFMQEDASTHVITYVDITDEKERLAALCYYIAYVLRLVVASLWIHNHSRARDGMLRMCSVVLENIHASPFVSDTHHITEVADTLDALVHGDTSRGSLKMYNA